MERPLSRAGQMTQWMKVPATQADGHQADGLSSPPGPYVVEQKNQLLPATPPPPHNMTYIREPTHTVT